MNSSAYFYIGIGLALVVSAWRGKGPFINESEFPATEEERLAAKPTRIGRIVVGLAGVAGCVYGFYALLTPIR